MKGKIVVAILSMVLIAVALVFCFNNQDSSQIMTEGTLVTLGLTL